MGIVQTSGKRNYSETEQLLIRHGLEIVILDGSEILSVLVYSLFKGCFVSILVYDFFFSWLKKHCGGWHCPTKGSCFMMYWLMYLCFCGLMCIQLDLPVHFLLVISVLYIAVSAPVQHRMSPMSAEEFTYNRHCSWIVLCAGTLLYILSAGTRMPVLFAFLYNALLCFILKHSKNYLPEVCQ